MANTPEQNVHSALKSLFTRTLPKGRWILQRIETSTGTGIPDCYFSFLNNQIWIETKTVDYKVSNEQLNWAYANTLAGGKTYLVTRIKHSPTTRPRTTTTCSNIPTQVTPYPTLLNMFKTPSTQGIISYDQLTNSTQKKGQETLVFLSFDDRMRECSTLGAYLRKFNPDVLPVEIWLAQQVTSQQS